MSSVGTSNPFAPNTALKDCSQGICSIYCPQWCYIIYSPPPPSFLTGDDNISDDDDSSAFQFSPLIVAVIGILASTFILITYYTIISRFCRHRIDDPTASQLDHDDRDSGNSDSAQGSNSGLDEALIKSITVCKYTKNGLVEGNDCSVCLSEFQENESLRLLPKCNHAFHLPCIDPWLKSHSSCPLCRSNISSNVTDSVTEPPEIARMNVNVNVNANAFEYEQRSDVVVVVQSSEELNLEEVVVSFGDEQDLTKISVGESQRRVSVADILNECDDDLELQREMI